MKPVRFIAVLTLALGLFFPLAANAKTTLLQDGMRQDQMAQGETVTLAEFRTTWTAYRKRHRSRRSRRRASRRTTNRHSTVSHNKGRIAVIRRNAINNSLSGLPRLRPYSSNYRRLVSAVRSYWRRNVTKPSTNGLTRTIMRYVLPEYRPYARAKVRASAARGVARVKTALRRK